MTNRWFPVGKCHLCIIYLQVCVVITLVSNIIHGDEFHTMEITIKNWWHCDQKFMALCYYWLPYLLWLSVMILGMIMYNSVLSYFEIRTADVRQSINASSVILHGILWTPKRQANWYFWQGMLILNWYKMNVE